jgi:hypothetical protein
MGSYAHKMTENIIYTIQEVSEVTYLSLGCANVMREEQRGRI